MNRVVIISDLHLSLGNGSNVEDFYADRTFAAFSESELLTPQNGGDIDLVLLGDTFDFWQTALDDAEYRSKLAANINLEYTAAAEVERLRRIRNAHLGFFASLKAFAARPNCRLTLLPATMTIPWSNKWKFSKP